MSSRHLSILLSILLLCGLALGLSVMLRGPAQVERSLVGLFQTRQEIIAEQAALRLSDSLRDVQVRLATAGEQLGAALDQSEPAEPLADTLARLTHSTDAQYGISLAILSLRGDVLAIDPNAPAELSSAIESFTQNDPNFARDTRAMAKRAIVVHRKQRLYDGSRLLTARLTDDLILAATINIDALATRNFNQAMGPRDIQVLLRDGRDGHVLVAVNRYKENEGERITGTAQVPDNRLFVEVSASRETIAPQIRRQIRTVVYISLSLVLLLLGAMVIVLFLVWRTHRENLERMRVLAHQDKLATIGLMAASTAHEIRNAITVASLQLQVAASTTREEDTGRHIDKATQSVNRLAKLAESLSRYAKKTNTTQSRFELSEAVQEALEIVEPKIKTRIALNLELQPGLYVDASRNEIVQVLVNLMINAVDATEANHGDAVTIRTGRQDGHALVSIIDTGAGIASGAHDKLFEPFFSTKTADDGEQTGTGIGLWLCAQIVDQHGGRIEGKNIDTGGAQFQVRLPMNDKPE